MSAQRLELGLEPDLEPDLDPALSYCFLRKCDISDLLRVFYITHVPMRTYGKSHVFFKETLTWCYVTTVDPKIMKAVPVNPT